MSYQTTTPNGSNTWKPDCMATFKDAAEDEGWVTLENGYNDGTYTRWVFRNADATFAIMFFCVTSALNSGVSNSTAVLGAGLMFVVGEEYNTTTRELYRLAPLRNNWAPAADCSIGATGYTPTKLVADGSAGPGYTGITTSYSTTSTYYGAVDFFWCSVLENEAFFGSYSFVTTLSLTTAWGFGEFSSRLQTPAVNDPVCIYVLQIGHTGNLSPGAGFTSLGTSNACVGSVTRSAMNPSSLAHDFRVVAVPEMNQTVGTPAYVSSSSTTYLDKYQGFERQACTAVLVRFGTFNAPAEASSFGHLRGELINALWHYGRGLWTVTMDDFTIGTDTYIYPGEYTYIIVKKAP